MKFLKFVAYSNLFIALSVALISVETFLIFDIPIDFLAVGYIFCSTMMLYGIHRIVGIWRNPSVITERIVWSQQHLVLIITTTIISGLGSGYFFFIMNNKPYTILIPSALISIGYSIPFWRVKNNWIRLRDINGIKIFLIGVVISVVTVYIPYGSMYNTDLLYLFVSRCIFIIAITIPFDIRDIEIDKPKLKTIGTVLGIAKAKKVSLHILLSFTILSLAAPLFTAIPISYSVAIALSGIASIVVINKINNQTTDLYYTYLVEGTMVLQFLLVYWITLI